MEHLSSSMEQQNQHQEQQQLQWRRDKVQELFSMFTKNRRQSNQDIVRSNMTKKD